MFCGSFEILGRSHGDWREVESKQEERVEL